MTSLSGFYPFLWTMKYDHEKQKEKEATHPLVPNINNIIKIKGPLTTV